MTPARIVILSGVHDYRTPRRAGVHGLAKAFAELGHEVRFVSIRFSALSLLRGDPRAFLWRDANRSTTHDGVTCYLWRTALHPVAPRARALLPVARNLHNLYARLMPRALERLIADATHVLVESGAPIALLSRIRRLNPGARIIYRCSDPLGAINAQPVLQEMLVAQAPCIDHVILLSRALAHDFSWIADRIHFVEQAVDPLLFGHVPENPFRSPFNAVSVGSMLFDETFFRLAAPAFPEVQFHVIGAGRHFSGAANVHVHGEMPLAQTAAYIRHATIGIAPYKDRKDCAYLADSSLKLRQYAHVGLPAVCPHYAAAGHPHRSGYAPGDAASIRAAITEALARAGTLAPLPAPTWREVAERTLNPDAFADTRIAPAAAAA